MTRRKLKLEKDLANSLVAYCESTLILPDDLLRVAMNQQISDTGSSNLCQRIYDSPWYVSTNCPYNGMVSRVEKVMRRMGFSWRYTIFVAWFICDKKGRLYEDDY